MNNILFDIELSEDLINDAESDKMLIQLVIDRIKTSMNYKEFIETKNSNKKFIYLLKDYHDKNIIIEGTIVNDKNRNMMLNIFNIDENEKIKLFKNLVDDNKFQSVKINYDSLSNITLIESYEKFAQLETLIRIYFILKLHEKNNCDTLNVIKEINVKDDISEFNKKIKNFSSYIQRIELGRLLEFLFDHPLGGNEHFKYQEVLNKTENIKNDIEIENELRSVLRKDNLVDEDELKILRENKGKISDFRNCICHNRIINCKEFKEIEQSIDVVINSLNKVIRKKLEIIFSIDQVESSKWISFSNENYENELLMYININEKFDVLDMKLMLFKMLSNVNHLVETKNIYQIEYDGIKYISENEDIIVNLVKLKPNEEKNNSIMIHIKYKSDEIYNSEETFTEIILKNMLFQFSVLYDSKSYNYNSDLYLYFNHIENFTRLYISAFYLFEGININSENKRIKGNLNNKLSIDGSNKTLNVLYEFDFIDLVDVLLSPNGGNKITKLRKVLLDHLGNKDYDKMKVNLSNMCDTNDDLHFIANQWEYMYKYRTIMAHNGLLIKSSYINIEKTCKEVKNSLENILFSYFREKLLIETSENTIPIKVQNLKFDILCNNNETIVNIKDNNENGNKIRINKLDVFRTLKITNYLKGIKDLNQFLLFEDSFEIYLDLYKDYEEEENIIYDFDSIKKAIEYLGYIDRVSFRLINKEEQKLEESVGKLLREVTQKFNKLKKEEDGD